jgi:glycosyl transferase family 25
MATPHESRLPHGDQKHIKIAVFVISLSDAEERRKIVAEYLSRMDLPWSFFDAVRGMPKDLQAGLTIESRSNLALGEIGCFLSHRAVWKEIATSDVDYAIILEDDTVLLPALDYRALFALLQQLRIDCIRLVVERIERAKALVNLGAPFGMVSRLTSPRFGLGTAGYALTPSVAGQLHTAASNINAPVDLWLERYSNHQLPIYNLLPPCAILMHCPSTITHRNVDQPRSILDYAFARIRQLLADCRDDWQLSRLDKLLRKRADSFQPGMANWPYSQLRKSLRRLLRWGE